MSFAGGLVWLGLAALSALIGCALLALRQQRNWRIVVGEGAARNGTAASGWSLIGLSFAFCVIRDGGSFAALLWPLLLAGAAFAVAMLLAYRARWLKPLAFLVCADL